MSAARVLWRGWAIQQKDGTLAVESFQVPRLKNVKPATFPDEKPIRIAVVLDEKARKKP